MNKNEKLIEGGEVPDKKEFAKKKYVGGGRLLETPEYVLLFPQRVQ